MIELEIKKELREWSRHALEKPSPFFNNFSPCPFAKKAWDEDRIGFVFKTEDDNLPLYQTISGFDDRYDLIFVVDLSYEPDPQRFEDYLVSLNNAISEGIFVQQDIWVMGFHPEDDKSELLDNGSFSPLVDDKYAIIFVQRLKPLQEKSEALKAKGYYDESLKDSQNASLYFHRESLYRRLLDGNETP